MELRLTCPSLGITAMSYHAQSGTSLQLVKFKTLGKNKINSFSRKALQIQAGAYSFEGELIILVCHSQVCEHLSALERTEPSRPP